MRLWNTHTKVVTASWQELAETESCTLWLSHTLKWRKEEKYVTSGCYACKKLSSYTRLRISLNNQVYYFFFKAKLFCLLSRWLGETPAGTKERVLLSPGLFARLEKFASMYAANGVVANVNTFSNMDRVTRFPGAKTGTLDLFNVNMCQPWSDTYSNFIILIVGSSSNNSILSCKINKIEATAFFSLVWDLC